MMSEADEFCKNILYTLIRKFHHTLDSYITLNNTRIDIYSGVERRPALLLKELGTLLAYLNFIVPGFVIQEEWDMENGGYIQLNLRADVSLDQIKVLFRLNNIGIGKL